MQAPQDVVGLGVAGLGQHEQELVGAVAAGEVALAQQGAQLVGPLAQHHVAAEFQLELSSVVPSNSSFQVRS